MSLNLGDTVRFRCHSLLGFDRPGQTGKVTAIHNYPAQGGPRIDVAFGHDVEKGVLVTEFELVEAG